MITLVKYLKFPLSSLSSSARNYSDEVTRLITSAGYRGERHEVVTSDGYVLSVHRIPLQPRVDRSGRCVFLMHGLFRNAADYFATGPSVALPYLLADRGFDVFLGNARGSKYCREHREHDFGSREFWNFSWEEIGLRDLPAMIELALDTSGREKVSYVGHSQGCTSALVMLAERPEWSEKLHQVHLMAPAAFLHHASSPAYRLGLLLQRVMRKIHRFDIGAVLELAKRMQKLKRNDPEMRMMIEMYKRITCRIVGSNRGDVQLSMDAIKSFNHFMSPTVSARQLRHFLQLYESGKFQKYDYGSENFSFYASHEPPEFDLSRVRVPTFLYHAENDALVDEKSVLELSERLPNVRAHHVIADYNHLDVMLGKNCRSDLYEMILDYLEE